MTKRERLARSLCLSLGHDPDASLYGPTADPLEEGWSPDAKRWQGCLGHVDVLLAELREPDEEMLEAGFPDAAVLEEDRYREQYGLKRADRERAEQEARQSDAAARDLLRGQWQAMLDAVR